MTLLDYYYKKINYNLFSSFSRNSSSVYWKILPSGEKIYLIFLIDLIIVTRQHLYNLISLGYIKYSISNLVLLGYSIII